MHYYQFNIAVYRKDTQHLSPIEHYIYRKLMDWYYLDEKPIPRETKSVLRRLRLASEKEPDLNNVLSEFFVETDLGWRHGRIDDEITKYLAKVDTARANGSKGGRPKKPKKTQPVNSANPEITGSKANQEPVTNNHKPKEKGVGGPPPFRADRMVLPSTVNTDSWAEWCAYRSSKKKPITEKAAEKQIELLTQHPDSVQRQIIETSIANDYQGLFPPKGGGKLSVVSGSTRTASIQDELTDTSWAR